MRPAQAVRERVAGFGETPLDRTSPRDPEQSVSKIDWWEKT